jgi:hypothetical protein
MAKINGVEIKNLKSFVGHEGICYQGDVWLDGKKLGFWSQDSWGAICDDFGFDTSVLDTVCKNYQDGFPDAYQYKEFCADKETFLNDLVILKEIEKDCKKNFKKGYKTVIYMTDGFHNSWLATPDDNLDENLLKKYATQVSEMKSQMFEGNHSPIVFRPNTFNITVDKKHPAPNLFMK